MGQTAIKRRGTDELAAECSFDGTVICHGAFKPVDLDEMELEGESKVPDTMRLEALGDAFGGIIRQISLSVAEHGRDTEEALDELQSAMFVTLVAGLRGGALPTERLREYARSAVLDTYVAEGGPDVFDSARAIEVACLCPYDTEQTDSLGRPQYRGLAWWISVNWPEVAPREGFVLSAYRRACREGLAALAQFIAARWAGLMSPHYVDVCFAMALTHGQVGVVRAVALYRGNENRIFQEQPPHRPYFRDICKRGTAEAVRYVLDHVSPVYITDEDLRRGFVEACVEGRLRTVRLLVETQPRGSYADVCLETRLQMCRERGGDALEVLDYLRDAFAINA